MRSSDLINQPSSILIGNPIPAEYENSTQVIKEAIEDALAMAEQMQMSAFYRFSDSIHLKNFVTDLVKQLRLSF
jgi:chromosome condensin MukBEF ATPase and DNA-binding subunit MukB